MPETNSYIDAKKSEFEKCLAHFKTELGSLRTGRAQPSLVENILVESYGATTPLKHLASISLPDSKTLSIEPWDKNIIKDIEKAFSFAKLNLSVVNLGTKLIIQLPAMTEESRKMLVKTLNEKAEDAKISIRQVRDEIKESIVNAETKKELTQDDKYQFLADLDNYVKDLNRKIEDIAKEKEEEIMTI